MAQGESRAPDLQNVSKLRILSGAARGRLLLSPAVYLRPMMGKVKAAVFSTLRSFGLYTPGFGPVKYLDVFSGSGSVGLESLSRSHAACGGGVSHFVDLAPECVSTVEANLERLQLEGGTAILADARKVSGC
jgi:16S rRNA G966 N2-methylase RsmD